MLIILTTTRILYNFKILIILLDVINIDTLKYDKTLNIILYGKITGYYLINKYLKAQNALDLSNYFKKPKSLSNNKTKCLGNCRNDLESSPQTLMYSTSMYARFLQTSKTVSKVRE